MSIVEKVRVSMYVEHTYVADVVMKLTAPDGTWVWIVDMTSGSGNDFGTSAADADRLVIDDDGATTTEGAATPIVGTYKPTNSMTSFIGVVSEGVWTLGFQDEGPPDVGTVHAVSLFLTVSGVETRYDTTDVPLDLPDDWPASHTVDFVVPDLTPGPYPGLRSDPYLEVRITPLLVGIAGQDEKGFDTDPESGTFGDLIGTGLVPIELADTTLLTQFSDLEVEIGGINEGRSARVLLEMDASGDPSLAAQEAAIEDLRPLQQALWVGYWRPGEVQSETIFFGQCNVIDDYEAGTVMLDAFDPIAKAQHHFIRRGDTVLNVDKNRGRVKPHADEIDGILDAARNTPEQQARAMPGLGFSLHDEGAFTDPPASELEPIDFERGQEVWDLVMQIARVEWGPDMDARPPFLWPLTEYATLDLYDAPTDPLAPGPTELGRNRDPADPDAPTSSEVVFNFGIPYDETDLEAVDPNNLTAVTIDPGTPVTHAHVVDRDANYRETSADAESSALVGAWVGWFATDFSVNPPHGADTASLRAIADVTVRAYGVPPAFTTLTLQPDGAMARHYGHPNWATVVDGTRVGGDWYLGDHVRLRALRGHRAKSLLARITAVKFKQAGSNGLLETEVTVVPSVGGTASDNIDEIGTFGGAPVGGGDPDPPAEPGTSPPDGVFTNLVLDEDFSGATVDTDIWYPYYGAGHGGNGLRDPAALTQSGGQLVISAWWDGTNIHSGGMAVRANYTYFRVEVRIRTEYDSSGQMSGLALTWPQSNHWPIDGENDFYETGRSTANIYRNPFHTYIHKPSTIRSQVQHTHAENAIDWHVMTMDVHADSLSVYRDGVLAHEWTDPTLWAHVPHHLSLQLDAFSNHALPGTVRMYVEYAKIWTV